jgi:predicted dinucleotide-binding enzyme
MSLHRREFLIATGAAVAAAALPLQPRAAEKVKIGVIGSGNVGGAIGASWVRAGHEVMFSSRHLEHDQALAEKLGGGAKAGTPQQAAAFGEVLLVAVPYGALPDVGKDLAAQIEGTVLLDACNPFPNRDGDIANWAREKGAGLGSAEWLAGASVVRAFNAIGAASMGADYKEPGRVGMPIAGDDAEALEIASAMIREIVYEPVIVGDAKMGQYLMPGTPLAGEHSAEEIRKIAADLD